MLVIEPPPPNGCVPHSKREERKGKLQITEKRADVAAFKSNSRMLICRNPAHRFAAIPPYSCPTQPRTWVRLIRESGGANRDRLWIPLDRIDLMQPCNAFPAHAQNDHKRLEPTCEESDLWSGRYPPARDVLHLGPRAPCGECSTSPEETRNETQQASKCLSVAR